MASISRHQETVSRSSSSSGTTVLISPISSACWASYWRHRNQISLAFLGPTRRDRTLAPKPPSNEPTLGPVWPKRALSAAIVRSQTTCRTWPPPTAYPATIATTGLGMRRIWMCRSVTWKPPTASLLPGVGRVGAGHITAPVAADALVPARAERIRALAGQDHDPDRSDPRGPW